jgi:hypothetical protein
MDALGESMHLAPALLDSLMSDEQHASPTPARAPTATVKRKSKVQKVINLALHFPRAAAKTAAAPWLAVLNQPGADLLRRVFAAAAGSAAPSTAQVLETLRDDPDFQYLERIVADTPLGIDDDEAATQELTASLEHLGRDAERAASVQRILGHAPGTGPG